MAFAAKHRAASYMALENPATKRLAMNILQNHADAVKEVHRLFDETERLSKLVTYWHNIHDAEFELRQKSDREFEGMCTIHEISCTKLEQFRMALRHIAWVVVGKEPDLGECMNIASEALKE